MGSVEEVGMGMHLLILLLIPLCLADPYSADSNSDSALTKTETWEPDISLDIEGQAVNHPGMDATSKACRYDDGPGWSDCDPFELERFKVLRLIYGCGKGDLGYGQRVTYVAVWFYSCFTLDE